MKSCFLPTSRQGITDTLTAYHKTGDAGDVSVMGKLMMSDVVINMGIEDFARSRDACLEELERRFEKLEDGKRKTLLDRPNVRICGKSVADRPSV